MDINKPCPECNCVKPYHDNIERAMNAKMELGLRFRQLHAQHAGELAYKELQLIEAQEGMKWMQAKVRKQAAAITRLEEKIRRLGNQPYANSDLEPIVPVIVHSVEELQETLTSKEKTKTIAELEPYDTLCNGTFVVTKIEYSTEEIKITGRGYDS